MGTQSTAVKKAEIKPSSLPKAIVPSQNIAAIDNIPAIAEGNRSKVSEEPRYRSTKKRVIWKIGGCVSGIDPFVRTASNVGKLLCLQLSSSSFQSDCPSSAYRRRVAPTRMKTSSKIHVKWELSVNGRCFMAT